MIEAKLLRKKLKNGLIVDKWDLVTIIEKQQAEIDSLQKNLDIALMIVNEPAKTLTDEKIIDLWNEMVDRKLLKKASEK